VSALAIVLIVLGGLALLLFTGGYVAVARRSRAGESALRAEVEQADRALALAHAADKGWEREGLERAARAAFAERSGGREPAVLELVQVVDRPGTDEDEAVFRAITDGGAETIHLARTGDTWLAR